MARRAGADGHRVVVAELNPEWGERTAAAIRAAGGEAHHVPCDVADPASVERLARAVRPLGPVWGLVNNAALANGVGGKEFQDIDVEVWDRLMAVNARGPWLVAKALHPLLSRPGRIVNVASDAALYGSPRLAHYLASKGAVIALTRGMARELGEHGITVNAVAPVSPSARPPSRSPPDATRCTRTTARSAAPSGPTTWWASCPSCSARSPGTSPARSSPSTAASRCTDRGRPHPCATPIPLHPPAPTCTHLLERLMDLGLAGRTVLVTGGSSGVGLATVRALLDEGANVATCGRDAGVSPRPPGASPGPPAATGC